MPRRTGKKKRRGGSMMDWINSFKKKLLGKNVSGLLRKGFNSHGKSFIKKHVPSDYAGLASHAVSMGLDKLQQNGYGRRSALSMRGRGLRRSGMGLKRSGMGSRMKY